MYKNVFILLFILAPSVFMVGQERNGDKEVWRQIVPLVTSREQVRSIMGPSTSGDDKETVSTYDLPQSRVTIWYLTPQAVQSSCVWRNVAPDTVVRVYVSHKCRPLLSKVGFDVSGFRKLPTPDDEVWDFVDDEKGVRIQAYDSSEVLNDKIVLSIELVPTAKDKKEKCLPPRE
jgi:hypothetical protein